MAGLDLEAALDRDTKTWEGINASFKKYVALEEWRLKIECMRLALEHPDRVDFQHLVDLKKV